MKDGSDINTLANPHGWLCCFFLRFQRRVGGFSSVTQPQFNGEMSELLHSLYLSLAHWIQIASTARCASGRAAVPLRHGMMLFY